ncbi:hypothetical protein [Dyadobacter sediminis]|uniref:Uncharacterized protein n=1 Tax=Dyadobacter sediminis TaxID=1493691 RepID=A0A5R9KKU7_9BACT|nr:hypothetical protein [Dyadobacter sediminis]TLU96759.1 hypothetical protein FEM55_06450 [Dyadobacter sediminis]GGB84928.1 hypothetical protein GCM10011325_10650 [Dyadobacter sediminis]
MPQDINARIKELQEKILSKRQQIDFERLNLANAAQLSDENRENPDSMEEAKNFNDPIENAVDKGEVKSLDKSEKELDELINELNTLRKS